MKILMVLTSHDRLGNTDQSTGLWIEEFAAPYFIFKDADAEVVLASPAGGRPPIDPKSISPDIESPAVKRFNADPEARRAFANTKRLREIKADPFDAVFYPGGHGPLWDLVDNEDSIRLIEAFWAQKKPVSAVCHGPAALLNAKTPDGVPIIKGRTVSAFTNTEEQAVGLTDIVPFLLEDELKARGAKFKRNDDWKPTTVQDSLLVTGQNPASSEPTANKLLAALYKLRKPELMM